MAPGTAFELGITYGAILSIDAEFSVLYFLRPTLKEKDF